MATTSKEIAWLKNLFSELRLGYLQATKLMQQPSDTSHCIQSGFHKRTKHIKMDCHYVIDNVLSGEITTKFIKSEDQLVDMFTKSFKGPRVNYICNKLGSYNIYNPT